MLSDVFLTVCTSGLIELCVTLIWKTCGYKQDVHKTLLFFQTMWHFDDKYRKPLSGFENTQ